MNRKERRAANKAKPAYLRGETRESAMKRLMQNGITPDDLKREYSKGFADGFKESGEPIIRSCFAAVCLALNDLYGFGGKRCMAVLNAVDQHMFESLSSPEIIDEVYKRMNLRLEFKEPFDRVQEL